jgi:hypothetical protein
VLEFSLSGSQRLRLSTRTKATTKKQIQRNVKPALCTFRYSDCAVRLRHQLILWLVDFNVTALYSCNCSLFFTLKRQCCAAASAATQMQLQQQHQCSFNDNPNDDIVSFCDSYLYQLQRVAACACRISSASTANSAPMQVLQQHSALVAFGSSPATCDTRHQLQHVRACQQQLLLQIQRHHATPASTTIASTAATMHHIAATQPFRQATMGTSTSLSYFAISSAVEQPRRQLLLQQQPLQLQRCVHHAQPQPLPLLA